MGQVGWPEERYPIVGYRIANCSLYRLLLICLVMSRMFVSNGIWLLGTSNMDLKNIFYSDYYYSNLASFTVNYLPIMISISCTSSYNPKRSSLRSTVASHFRIIIHFIYPLRLGQPYVFV